jgi:uncharacterized delta-60 repeat protein
LDQEGNVYVAGYTNANGLYNDDFGVIKLNARGELDNTFGDGGKAIIDFSGNRRDKAFSLVLDQQGNVYVAGETYVNGSYDFGVIKLNSSGVLDTSFGENGKAIIDISGNSFDTAYSLALDEQGNVYVAGYTNANGSFDFGVIKLNASGELYSGFGENGKAIIDFSGNNFDIGRSLVLDQQGNVYVAGYTNVNGRNDFGIIKLDASGELNTTFGVDGKAIIDFSGNSIDIAYSLALDEQGNVYVAGETNLNGRNDFGIIKLDASGVLVNDFGENGKANIDITGNSFDKAFSLALDSDGNVYVAGEKYDYDGNDDFVVIKLNESGVLDTSFGVDGKAIIDISGNSYDVARSLALDQQGNIYVAGETDANGIFDFGVIKLNARGELANDFGEKRNILKERLLESSKNTYFF